MEIEEEVGAAAVFDFLGVCLGGFVCLFVEVFGIFFLLLFFPLRTTLIFFFILKVNGRIPSC